MNLQGGCENVSMDERDYDNAKSGNGIRYLFRTFSINEQLGELSQNGDSCQYDRGLGATTETLERSDK